MDVAILNLGTWYSPGADRLLRFVRASGVRSYDTADCSRSEPAIAWWRQAMPEMREASTRPGEVRFVRFSCHGPSRAEFPRAAAEGA